MCDFSEVEKQKPKDSEGESLQLNESIPKGGNSRCKGPGAGEYLAGGKRI